MEISMKIDGIDELNRDFERLVRKYPDKAGDLLQERAKELRKDVVKRTKKVVHINSKQRESLGKLGNYKMSQIRGYGGNQSIDISATSPHFHLIEHGHDLTDKQGRPVGQGHVQGYHIMADTVRAHQRIVPKMVSEMVGELLKEEGL